MKRKRARRSMLTNQYAVRVLGEPWPEGNAEHAALLAAIGRALDLDGPLPEWRVGAWTGLPYPSHHRPPDGLPSFQVLAGRADVDLDYVVWVEEYNRGLSDPDDDPEDAVEVLINLAGAGVRHLPRIPQPSWVRRPGSPWISLVLEEDRPDRVANIRSLQVRGRELIAVYARPNVPVECRFAFDPTGTVQVHRTRASQ